MEIVASLPHLESLDLVAKVMLGPEWDICDQEFLRLKYLNIDRNGGGYGIGLQTTLIFQYWRHFIFHVCPNWIRSF